MILTKIYINNEEIDLKDDVSLALNFDIADIREPQKKGTTWSKTVVLPGSSFNNDLFSNIWNVNAVIDSSGATNFNPNFNPNLKAKAEIYYNNALQFTGICQLLNVNVTDKYEINYEVAFFGELQNIYQFFTNKYLRDVDLSQYNHAYTLHNQYLSWSAPIGVGYVYPHIDYGRSINSEFKVEHIYPAIYIKTIIDKMFSQAGYTYQSNFFNSDLFKRLILPYNGKSDLKLTTTQIDDRSFRASKTATQTETINGGNTNGSNKIYYQDKTTPPNNDAGNNFYDYNGGTSYNTFVASRSGDYTFTFYIKATVEHYPSTATATLSANFTNLGTFDIIKNPLNFNYPGQRIASIPVGLVGNGTYSDVFQIRASTDTYPYTITSGTTTDMADGTLSVTVTLNENDIIQTNFYEQPFQTGLINTIYKDGSNLQTLSTSSYCKLNILDGSYFTGVLANSAIQSEDIVELSYNLPDNVKQSDFFDSIVKMFNLFVEVDKADPNKLLIEPRVNFYNNGTIRDWSDKLDYSKETKIIPMGELNNKTYLFTYKEDGDYFNSYYKNKFGEIYGQRKYDIQNDFLKGEVKTELIFSPTPLVDTIGHDRVMPKIYTLGSNGQITPTGSNMRILYYGGLKDTSYPWAHIATSGTTYRNDYAYCGHLDDWQNPTLDLNFGVIREAQFTVQNWTTNNLYNKYWKDYIEQIADKDSKLFVGYFYLNEFDIQSLDFRDSFFFENEIWRLNKIIDYDRINNQTTKCEFIKLKTLPPYEDDNGFPAKGGIDVPAPTGRMLSGYNGNYYPEGAIVSGRNNNIQSGDGVIVSGNDNTVGIGAKNVSITSSSGVTILGGITNVSVTNSSGITVTESNVSYDNGIKTQNSVSYKKYIALLFQTATDNPIVYILENTLSSEISWTRIVEGQYDGVLTGEFTENKVALFCSNPSTGFLRIKRTDSDTISIYTYKADGTTGDGRLNYTTIEIRVYS